MLRVLRVLLFGDILVDARNRNICPDAGGFKADTSGGMSSVAYDRGDRGHRHDPSRQYVVAHQGIQDRGFTTLKLTDASNVKTSLRYPFCYGSRIGCDLLG